MDCSRCSCRILLTLVFICFLVAALQAQTVTLLPASLAFGSRVLATSTTIKVTLKNNLSVALNITSIAASGDFAQTNTCGTSLAAGIVDRREGPLPPSRAD